MGTNYYAVEKACPNCHRGDTKKHMGKSSYGWHFALHVYPEEGINTLQDWMDWLEEHPDAIIVDEYGSDLFKEEFFEVVTERTNWHSDDGDCPYGYASWEEFYRSNHAEPGVGGLVRHKLGPCCVGHGEGTWDYFVGEFS